MPKINSKVDFSIRERYSEIDLSVIINTDALGHAEGADDALPKNKK